MIFADTMARGRDDIIVSNGSAGTITTCFVELALKRNNNNGKRGIAGRRGQTLLRLPADRWHSAVSRATKRGTGCGAR